MGFFAGAAGASGAFGGDRLIWVMSFCFADAGVSVDARVIAGTAPVRVVVRANVGPDGVVGWPAAGVGAVLRTSALRFSSGAIGVC